MLSVNPVHLADLVSDGVLVVRAGRITDANRSILGLLRAFVPENLVDLPIEHIWPDADMQKLEPLMLSDFVRLDGTKIPVSVRFNRAHQMDPQEFVFSVQQVESMPWQKARYASDLCPEAVFVVDLQTLDHVDVNRAACELLGVTRDELMARGSLAGWVRTGSTEQAFRDILQVVVARAPSISMNRQVWRRSDGVMIPVSVRASAHLLEGRWIIYAAATPVSAQGDMSATPDQFRSAIDLNPDAVWLIDYGSHRCVDVNDRATRLLGYDRQDLIDAGLTVLWSTSPAAVGERDQFLAQLVNCSPQAVTRETQLVHKSGRRIPVELSCNAIVAQSRWVFFIHARNISERVQAALKLDKHVRELERSNAELQSFAYVASHDLTEPLRMVASYLQLLSRRYSDKLDTDAQEFIGFAVDGAKRMQRLLNDLLMYSRAGRKIGPRRLVPFETVIEEVLANLAQRIEASSAVVHCGALPALRCDRTAMLQVLQNLVGNALKFQHPDRPLRVSITAERDQDQWLISVCDNGIGIASEYFDRIFQIFQRLHTREQFEGTGVGLAICKKIVDSVGGRIWVESEIGHGTCFKFTLPDEGSDYHQFTPPERVVV